MIKLLCAVTLEAENLSIPACCFSWIGPVAAPSESVCVIKHVILSVDVSPMLKLGFPHVVVFFNGADMCIKLQRMPSVGQPSFAFGELIRYLIAVERILFTKLWILRFWDDLQQSIATQAAALALFTAAQCLTVSVRAFSLRILTSHCPGNIDIRNLPEATSAVRMHIASIRLLPARTRNQRFWSGMRNAEVEVVAGGIDLTCCFLRSASELKMLRRWGFEASVKLYNKVAQILQVAKVHGQAKVTAKALVLCCGPEQVQVLHKLVHAYIWYKALLMYAGHRPSQEVQKDPAAWWRYAIRCTLHHICQYPAESSCSLHHLGKLPKLLDAYARQQKRPGESQEQQVQHDGRSYVV